MQKWLASKKFEEALTNGGLSDDKRVKIEHDYKKLKNLKEFKWSEIANGVAIKLFLYNTNERNCIKTQTQQIRKPLTLCGVCADNPSLIKTPISRYETPY